MLNNSKYLYVEVPANVSTYNIIVPSAFLPPTKANQVRRISLKKLCCRNCYQTVVPGSYVTVNGGQIPIRDGTPSAILFAQVLSSATGLVFSFDAYDGRFVVYNATIAAVTLGPGSLGARLGLTSPTLVAAGGSVRLPGFCDLSPPDLLVVRSNVVSTDSVAQHMSDPTAKYSNIFAIVPLGDTPPSGSVTFDDSESRYEHIKLGQMPNAIHLSFEDQSGNTLTNPFPILIVISSELYEDVDSASLHAQKQQTDLLETLVLGASMATWKPPAGVPQPQPQDHEGYDGPMMAPLDLDEFERAMLMGNDDMEVA